MFEVDEKNVTEEEQEEQEQSLEIKTFSKDQTWSYLKRTAWCVLLRKGHAWTLGWS